MGANSTIIAMGKWPEEFAHIMAVALINALTERHAVEKIAEVLMMAVGETTSQFDKGLHQITGFRLDEMTPLAYAHGVKVPTLMLQMRRELFVNAEPNG
jgi:hypothetical protein